MSFVTDSPLNRFICMRDKKENTWQQIDDLNAFFLKLGLVLASVEIVALIVLFAFYG